MVNEPKDGLVRVSAQIAVAGRVRASSVSLDSYLFGLLARRLGGAREATQWVKAEAARLSPVRGDVLARAGLSRLVQRSVIRYLFEPPATKSPGAAQPAAAGD